MKITEVFFHNKLHEMKQSHGLTKSKKNDSNIHSLMLLSNPFVSSQIKSKYSSLISNAVCSFLDHNPREKEASTTFHSIQMGIASNRKLMNTRQAITNFLNSSVKGVKEKKGQSHLPKCNYCIHGPNPFDGLTINSTKANLPKKTHRSCSSDDSTNIMKKIKDFTSTINRPMNMTSTHKITIKKDSNDLLVRRLLVNSASVRDTNMNCVKTQLNACNYSNKHNDQVVFGKADYKLMKERGRQNNEEGQVLDETNSLFHNDLPLTDKQNNSFFNLFHQSPILKDSSCIEEDTFSSFKSYLLLNSPNA